MDDALSVLKHWRQDLEGSKQKTYKFVLQCAILSHIKERGSSDLDFDGIAKSFIKQYWNNVIYFGFRETTHDNQRPVIEDVLKGFVSREQEFMGLNWAQAKKKESDLDSLILKYWEGRGSNGPNEVILNPIKRLQVETEWLYDIKNYRLVFKQDTVRVLLDLEATLRDLTCLNWAKFIEKQNPSIPRVLKKLSALDELKERAIPKSILEFMRANDPAICFYCNRELGDGKLIEEIDHYVPYSFVFEHSLWNLVRTCKPCNGAKSDRLAPIKSGFEEKLIGLNSSRLEIRSDIFNQGADFGADHKTALQRARQICENSGFQPWPIEEHFLRIGVFTK